MLHVHLLYTSLLSLSPYPPPLLCNYNQALSPVSPLQCLDPCWHCSLSSPGEGFGSPGEGSESPAEPHPRPLGGWGSLTSLPVSHTHQTSLKVTLYCSLSLYLMSCLEMEIQPKSTWYTKCNLDKAVIKFKSAPHTWCNALLSWFYIHIWIYHVYGHNNKISLMLCMHKS